MANVWHKTEIMVFISYWHIHIQCMYIVVNIKFILLQAFLYCFTGPSIVIVLDLQLPMRSVPITTNIVSSSPAHSEVYLIQHYVIKFFSDLRRVGGFLRFPPPIKLTTTTI